ncbi:MAG: AAA family ATPase, partial [Sulfurovaceae bacterium]|nr:AAA family ATPase [Sulfurovaceae bacterium]
MRLTKLYIHNYKSFYDTTIELDKMNIVVGENNSGKSNLIDVLEFIDIIIEDFNKAIIDRGGFEKFLNYNYTEEMIVIELELEDNLFKTVRRFTFNKKLFVMSGITCLKINSKLIPLSIMSVRINFKLNKTINKRYTFSENIESLIKNYPNKIEMIMESFTLHLMSIAVSIPIKTYTFNIEKIRTDSHKESVEDLLKNGTNLGKNLFEIKNNYPEKFELISNSMIGIVNEIDGIDVQETFGNYLIGFNEKNKQIGIDMVSDGTINLL